MRALVLVVVSVGLIDCLNPSTIGPALYLATRKRPLRSIAGFTLGVFVVYLLGGIVLTLGPGRLLVRALPHPGATTVAELELGAGAVALVVASLLWLARARIARRLHGHERRLDRSSILLGGAIMAVELPTAVPYFAVIAAVADSGRGAATQIGLLVLFNLLFVAPLLAIIVVVKLAGAPGARVLAAAHERLHRHAPVLIPAAVLALGVVLLALGAVGLG
jgi:cytochrome c biogenesis protein CcdA